MIPKFGLPIGNQRRAVSGGLLPFLAARKILGPTIGGYFKFTPTNDFIGRLGTADQTNEPWR
jgi:hypothetical protein